MSRPRTRDKVSATPKWTNAYMTTMLAAADNSLTAEGLQDKAVEAYVEGDWIGSAAKLRLAAEELYAQADFLAKAAGILETGRDAA